AQRGWSVWYDPAATVLHHRPLHTRAVPPHLYLITRHALLTYAGKHWPAWQAGLMAWIVRLETWLAGWRTRAARDVLAALDGIAGALLCGRTSEAGARMRRVVRRQEEDRAASTGDRHPLAPPGRPAGAVPGEHPPACPGGHRGAGGR